MRGVRQLKLKVCVWGIVSLFSIVTLAGDLSGCLVYDGKKLITDVNCACVTSNSCAKFQKLKFDSDFFNSKDKKDKNLFPENLKNSYKASYEQYNKIIELKSQGKGNSEEIKEYYQKLDKTNGEVRQQLIKAQPLFMAKKRLEYAAFLEKKKLSADKIAENIQNFVSGSSTQKLNLSKSTLSSPAHNSSSSMNSELGVKSSKFSVSLQEQKTSDSSEENKYILRNLKAEKYQVDDQDSLFDVISKTYFKKAYKDLLSP